MEKLLQLYKFVDGVNDSPFPNATQQAILYEFRYDAKRMGNAPTISGTLMHPLCLDNLWGNDLVYIVYNSERYFLKQTPTSSYSNEDTRYKHEVDFVSERIVLDDVYFYDVVQGDTNIDKPVSNSSSFTFYGDIHEFAQRLNYSLQYAKVGYSVVVDEGISSEAKMISFQNQFIANALQESYNTYEIPYYFVGKVIHIGFTDNAISRTFKYGIDDALLSITKSNANYKVVNRVTGTGSSDNIPYYYPNRYESKEQVEAEGGTWIPPQTNLMPPIYRESLGEERFYNALNSTYINPQTDEYYEFANPYQDGKPKEQIVSFDDIKPSIVGITNASGARIDMFSDFAYDRNDNDETDEEGNYLHPYFFAKLRQFDGAYGFNLFDHAIEEDEMVISMTSGNCGACNFVIGVDSETQKNTVQVDANGNLLRDDDGNILFGSPQDRQNDTQNYEVWIALRKDIETFGVIMPNATNNYKPNAGDTFVILHIDLPQSYIEAAENRLKEEIIKYMAMNNSEKFTFSITFSRIFFAENPSILAQLNENARLQIEYNNKTYELYVSSYSYNMTNDKALPEIRVELSDTLTITQNALQTAISEVKTDIMNSVGSIDWLRLGLKYFLRKDTNDRSKGKVASDVGFEIGKYVSGTSGAIVYEDKTTGQTVAELDKLFVRMKAYFETLEIINANSVGGKQIISPAGSIKCTDVKDREVDASGNEIVWDYYRCYFLNEQDGEKVENRFVVGDQAYSQLFNAQSGVSNNISNKYYWRLIVGVGENYIDLSKSDCDSGSDIPEVGDVICHRGNRNDVDRQNVIEVSSVDAFSPSITLYQGINSYSLSGKDIVSFGVDKTTNKAFMNVYGDMYIGDRNNTSYMRYTQEKGLELKGKLEVGSTISNAMTVVEDGLIQSTLLKLGYYKDDVFKIMSGTNGLYDENALGGGIAAWYGGPMADKEADSALVEYAQSLFRFDGSGYLAGGNITWDKDGAGSVAGGDIAWDKDGAITLGVGIKISGDENETLGSILSSINKLLSWFDEDRDGDIYVKGNKNFYTYGAISFGGKSTSGGGGGDITTLTKEMVIQALGYIPYDAANPAKYITNSALVGYAKLTDIPSIPTALPNPYSLTINGTSYDGSSSKTINITAESLGALTEHQDISHLLSKATAKDTYATITALNGLQASHNALRNEFDALNKVLNDDVSGKINTWNEVVNFLDEYSGSQDLATILSGMNADIADRALQSDLESHISAFSSYKNETDKRLDSLESMWFFDPNNAETIRTIYNVAVERSISFGGYGEGSTGSGGITEVTKEMVISALGYTPYNASNPSKYATEDWVTGKLSSLSGFDESAMWTALGTDSTTKKISANYIGDLSAKYLSIQGGEISGDITRGGAVWGVDTSARGIFMSWDENYLHITNDGAYYNWQNLIHSGNIGSQSVNYATSAGDADTLDGIQYQNILERSYSRIAPLTTEGWYRIAKIHAITGASCTLYLYHNYFHTNNCSYIFSITCAYNNVNITQIGGSTNTRTIDKVRVSHNGSERYIDIHLTGTANFNDYFWTIVGAAEAIEAISNPTALANNTEFATAWTGFKTESLTIGSTLIEEKEQNNTKYVEIDGNLVVKGSISFGGVGNSGGTSGGLTSFQITIGNSVYTSEGNNVTIPISSLRSALSINNVTNLAARDYLSDLSSNATNAISLTVGGTTKYITATALKTSLGLGSLAYKSSLTASDIPSLDWSKITSGKPTTVGGYGITDAITTGNIGSQSVAFATSSQQIKRVESVGTSYNLNNHTQGGLVYNYYSPGSWVNGPTSMGFGQVWNIRDNVSASLSAQLAWDVIYNSSEDTTGKLWWRASDDGSFTEAQWHQIAYTDSDITGNAASATKLQTAINIYGNLFDGTQDLSKARPFLKSSSASESIVRSTESITIGTSTQIRSGYSSGIGFNALAGYSGYEAHTHAWIGLEGYVAGAGTETYNLVFATNDNTATIGASPTERMRITPSGNILIGTTTDNGQKLQVIGTVRVSNWFYSDENTGWYSVKYKGGIYMEDETYVTVYNGKAMQLKRSDGGLDAFYVANRTDTGHKIGFGIGSGGVNRGIWDYSNNRWAFYINGNGAHIVGGNLVAAGAITFGSDERYKTKLSDVSVTLEDIANAPLFNYLWNDREDNKEHLGTTAQYWNKTNFRNAVCPNDEKLWTMSYSEIAMGNTIVLARELIPIKNDVQLLKEKVNRLESILREHNINFS